MSKPYPDLSQFAPKLLVSVRDCEEAKAALAGGCEILDIKEPERGSLGMADASISTTIVQYMAREAPHIPVSAALGEVTEWNSWRATPAALHSVTERESAGGTLRRAVPDGCAFLKIGCAGLGNSETWRSAWSTTRQSISRSLTKPVDWVAVAYVDWRLADAPSILAVVQAALEEGCRGILFDTWSKSGGWLLDWISTSELRSLADRIHVSGLFLALAGSLSHANVHQLKNVPADVLAIRGAACESGRRTEAVSATAVRAFKQQL